MNLYNENLNEDENYHYCDHCGRKVTGIFCNCNQSIKWNEENKREILNDLFMALNTFDVKLEVRGKKWA